MKKACKAEEDARLKQEREKAAEEERQRKKAELERANIWNFLDRFGNNIKTGKRLNGNDSYTPGRCKGWSSFRKLYNDFDPRHKLTWGDVDRELVTKFLAHLAKLDYMGSSINKYHVSFRAMRDMPMPTVFTIMTARWLVSPNERSRKATRRLKFI